MIRSLAKTVLIRMTVKKNTHQIVKDKIKSGQVSGQVARSFNKSLFCSGCHKMTQKRRQNYENGKYKLCTQELK